MSTSNKEPSLVPYQDRLHKALSLQQALKRLDQEPVEVSTQLKANEWLADVDPRRYVGSVHHTVPRFLLDRWSRKNQVEVYSRLSNSYSTRNVKDLAVRDFYTFIDRDGERNSTFESLLGTIESPIADITKRLLSPFSTTIMTTPEEKYALAQFAAFQAVRTTRRRRELELHGEWFAKTLAQGRLADADLRELRVTPPQNDLLVASMKHAGDLIHFFAFRPLEVVFLQDVRLRIGDEPLLINGATREAGHLPDCFLTDEQFKAKVNREARKKLKRRKEIHRTVHFRPTQTQGIGVALELILPISPKALLWWGPLQNEAFDGGIEAQHVTARESAELADLVNKAMTAQALDWVVASRDDDGFRAMDKPALEPLMTVCDGNNAAAAAINTLPTVFRPGRL
ncbi:DUF4238 domain-containing protein [Kineococcus sp. NBC_00420]|uniref:DUF4238 domain-containing protein n=1 Tax=Kineococcus sp. NBC_00420 TaxID=2903564 RepID=UPI002E1FF997